MLTPEVVTALGPSIGVIIVVVSFLKHLQTRDKRLTISFDKNTKALNNNATIMGQVLEALRNENQ